MLLASVSLPSEGYTPSTGVNLQAVSGPRGHSAAQGADAWVCLQWLEFHGPLVTELGGSF